VGLLKTARYRGLPSHPEGSSMAKALIGYMNSDLRTPARLTAENDRLRTRVHELETLVRRLSEENDRLAQTQAAMLELDPSALAQMQPV